MSAEQKISVIVLAAGKGTRMMSPLPKVLHPVAGVPMVTKVIQACQKAGATDIRAVVGFGQNLVRSQLEPLGVQSYVQVQQLGTADAVKSAQIESLEGLVIIINGDHPLITEEDIKGFITQFRSEKADIAVVTAELKNPGEFGRVIRYHGEVHAIVEARDASADTLKVREVNTGIYILTAEAIQDLLPQVKNHNAKKEYYLTDIISLGKEQGYKIVAVKGHPRVSVGVNNQEELARASRIIFRRKAKALMESGVVIIDPRTTYIEEDVQIGQASVIYPGAYIRGGSKIGQFCLVEPNCYINSCELGDSVQVRASTYMEKSKLHDRVTIGPFARLRPETELLEESHVGNFVEMKKVKFGKKSKAGHLTYLGDAEIGEEVNVGCGTITCNYAVDKNKYKTKIGNRVFIGSDSQFVAPIEIGDDAIIASGSTITENVPAKALGIARARQVTKSDYQPKSPAKKDK